METQTRTDTIEPTNALAVVVQESGLDKTKADYILEKFQDYFKIASYWEKMAKTIIVSSPEQKTEMKMAREGRLLLRQKRIDVEKARKELKEQSLREGKAIDGIANVLKALIEPIEEYLDKQERFVEIQEEEMRVKRLEQRLVEIQTVNLDPAFYDIKNMPEENYRQLIDGERQAIQTRIEEIARIEAERIAKEKAEAEERERMRLENERQKKELEEKERQLKKEREEAEKKQRAIEETARKEKAEAEARERKLKAEQDAKLKKEREERERLQAELKAKTEAEARERERIKNEERAARRAPDKQKLIVLAETIESFELPEMKSVEAKKVLEDVRGSLGKVGSLIRERAAKL